jgi:hypothetical protein
MIWKVLVSAPFFVLPWEWAVNEIAFLNVWSIWLICGAKRDMKGGL